MVALADRSRQGIRSARRGLASMLSSSARSRKKRARVRWPARTTISAQHRAGRRGRHDHARRGRAVTDTQIDHVGCAVRSLEDAIATLGRIFGLDVALAVDVPGLLRSAFLSWGNVSVELVERAGTEWPANAPQMRLDHLAFRSASFDAELERLRAIGLVTETGEPRFIGGRRAIFFAPASTGGIRLQLVEATA